MIKDWVVVYSVCIREPGTGGGSMDSKCIPNRDNVRNIFSEELGPVTTPERGGQNWRELG